MAEIVQKPVRSVYKDGSIVVSNVKSKIDNSTTSYTVVENWYDGTPMNDSKVDQFGIYSKFKETGEYLRENKPQWGELFLEIDTMSAFRQMSPIDQYLVIIGYYKGVRIGGYHKKGDTPGAIDYYLNNNMGGDDDGGSIIKIGANTFYHEFSGEVNAFYFGVKGDGIYDDYLHLLQIAKYVNLRGGNSTVEYPSGSHIYIATRGETGKPVPSNIVFDTCKNLTILGYGCKFSANATFHRTTASDRTICPFSFRLCEDIVAKGFELNGNSQNCTKAAGLAESASYGIIVNGCINFLLEDVYMHHFITDGMRIDGQPVTGYRISSKNFVGRRVRSNNNARQGISIVQLRGGYFESCEFNQMGMTSGYGSHSPSAGIDIEPNRNTNTPAPNNMDVNTGDITFYRCDFIDNSGSQFVTALPNSVDNIYLIECRLIINYRGLGGGGDGLIFDTNGGYMIDCYVNLQDKYFYAAGYATNALTKLEVKGCVIESRRRAIFSFGVSNYLLVENTRFIAKGDEIMSDLFIQIRNPKAIFRNNYIFIPQGAWKNNGTGDRHIIMEVSTGLSENNIYETDLTPDYLGSTSAHFANLVTSGYSNPTRNDTYKGMSPGPADTIRPSFNSAYNTNSKYSFGDFSAGNLKLRKGNTEGEITYSGTRPIISKAIGDIQLNSSPNETTARNAGWISVNPDISENYNIPYGFIGEYSGTTTPNGNITARPGARYTQILGVNGILWIKKVGNDNQGWEPTSDMKTGKAISNIATSNATTPETTMALVNELKAKINELLQDRRDTKQQSLI